MKEIKSVSFLTLSLWNPFKWSKVVHVFTKVTSPFCYWKYRIHPPQGRRGHLLGHLLQKSCGRCQYLPSSHINPGSWCEGLNLCFGDVMFLYEFDFLLSQTPTLLSSLIEPWPTESLLVHKCRRVKNGIQNRTDLKVVRRERMSGDLMWRRFGLGSCFFILHGRVVEEDP